MSDAIEPLDEAAVEANTETLTDLYITSEIKMPWWFENQKELGTDQILDTAIATLAKYGSDKTISEILKAEDLDPTRSSAYTPNLVTTMILIHSLWVDTAVFIARPDNLMNSEAASKDQTAAGSKDRGNRAIAEIVIANGQLMRVDESFYGWADWDGKKEKIVAAFDLKTDHWDEFNGTFATETDSRSGFTLHVLYEDGTFRKLRYEADFGEIIRQF